MNAISVSLYLYSICSVDDISKAQRGGFKRDSRSVRALKETLTVQVCFQCCLFHSGVMWGQCNWNYAKNAVANSKGQTTALVPQL